MCRGSDADEGHTVDGVALVVLDVREAALSRCRA
jgi:hypothetical protein